MSLGSGVDQHSLSRLTRLTSARFHGRAPGPYPAGYTEASGWRTGAAAPAFPLPFGRRHSLLGRPVPATESSSPYGRPTGDAQRAAPDLDGFPRSTRMSYDRVGCQLYPGSSGVHTTVDPSSVAARRFSTARSSSSPPTRPDLGELPQRGITTGSLTLTLPVFPSPVTPGRNGHPWAFP